MKITYTAPNRSHHYRYAAALAKADCLEKFVCGFSRYSPRAALPEIGPRLIRADHLQNLYLASLKLRMPRAVSAELAYVSKIWLDHVSEIPARASDLFLFYSGAGLRTARRLEGTGVLRIVEAVNSHVLVQEEIMREEHRLLGLRFRPFHQREVERRIAEYQLADAILCPSAFVKQSFEQQGYAADRILVVPYGLPAQASAPVARGAGDGVFRVLYVGQIDIRKGLRYLFEAFAGLRHPRKELWIAGPTTAQTGIARLTPPEGTKFLGVLKGAELARAYREASVFVLPTVEEGLALVLGEALSFGLPVIATVNSGGADLFQDGREGFLVPIRDPRAIGGKLQELADDPKALETMSLAAQARAQTLRGWEGAGQMLVDTLKEFAQSRRGKTEIPI